MSLCYNETEPHNVTPSFNHNGTVAWEQGAAATSLVFCSYFYVIMFLIRRVPAVKRWYSWPTKSRISSLAFLVLLQAITFWTSAAYGFDPPTANIEFCRVQGMVYQFATSGIAMEVFAVSYAAFKTIVVGVSFAKFKEKYTVNLFVAVYVVAVVNTIVPYIAEQFSPTNAIVYGVIDKSSGYCWMNFRRNCAMVFVYFYYVLQILAHGCSIVLGFRICRTLCRLHGHLKKGARRSIKVFIARRMVILGVAAIYFIVSFTYAVMYWSGLERGNVGFVVLHNFCQPLVFIRSLIPLKILYLLL